MDVWKPARILSVTKVNAVRKIKSLSKQYKKLKNCKKETKSLKELKETLKQRLMIEAENAEFFISKDPDFLPKDKVEDLKFLSLLKNNQVVSLGPVDRGLFKRIT